MKKLLTILIALMAILPVMAARVQIGNLYYNLDSDTKTAEVTYLSTNSSENQNYVTGSLSIPNTVQSGSVVYNVTSIGKGAFWGCRLMTSVTIPTSVTLIGDRAFAGCNSLRTLTIPNSVTQIGDSAFINCSGATQLTIPSSVKTIGVAAFQNCDHLTSLSIPSSVTSISDCAFLNCSSATRVTIPSSVKTIGERAFSDCRSLTSVTIPNSVTVIRENAFKGCSSLTSVTIPNSVTSIGESAFSQCSGLKTVTIPSSVTYMHGSSFAFCQNLTSINVNTQNQDYTSVNGVVYSKDRSTIVAYPSGLKGDFEIPNYVNKIGSYAFYSNNLTNIKIPTSVTTIEESAFRSSSLLTSIIIPNSVLVIRGQAFSDCANLESINISSSLRSIADGCFQNCSKLNKINVDEQNQYYADVDGVLFSKDLSKIIIFPPGRSGEYIIPNSVTTIGRYSFYTCKNLTSIRIPNLTTSIESSAITNSGISVIYNCATLPQNVNSNIISGTKLSEITLYVPEASKELYEQAEVWKEMNIKTFDPGIQETVIVLVDDIIYIVETSKGTASCKGPREQSIVRNNLEIKSAIEYGGDSYPVVFINENAFQKCTGLTGPLTIPHSVTTLGKYAFDGCSNLDEVKIGNSLEEIGFGAFYNCTGLKNVSFETPSSLVSIEDWAFNNCVSLTSIDLPASLTTLKYCAFYNCEGLKEITMPESLTSIGEWVFNGCKSLTSVELPNTITEIEDFAFYACSGLTKVNIPTSLQSIGNQVFANCNLSEIVIPASVNEIGTNAFGGNVNLMNVYSYNPIPPTCADASSFSESTKSNGKLYVPSQSVSDYQAAVCWKDFNYTTYIPVEATDIQLNKSELTIFINQEETLIVTLTPKDATSEIVWSTQDNDNVISVNQAGMVKALSVGTAKVVVTADDLSATCEVTVLPVLATSISIDGEDINTLKETETLQLTAGVLPENVTYPEVSWKSSNTGMATVEDNGLVTAVGVGEVDITAFLTHQPEVQASYHLSIEKRVPGDANDNGLVNVADVITIAEYIVHKNVFNFCFVNADVVSDKEISSADVTATVNIILDEIPSLTKLNRRKGRNVSEDLLIVDNFRVTSFDTFNIPVDLNAKNSYSALQATILIPEGMTVEGISLGEKAKQHILNYNQTEDNRIDLIIYSFNNTPFLDGTGSLFDLAVSATEDCGDMILTGIRASDSESNEFELRTQGGHNVTQTTSIGSFEESNVVVTTYISGIEILNAEGYGYQVYSLAGESIVSDTAQSNLERISLDKGIYIIVVNGKAFKALVK